MTDSFEFESKASDNSSDPRALLQIGQAGEKSEPARNYFDYFSSIENSADDHLDRCSKAHLESSRITITRNWPKTSNTKLKDKPKDINIVVRSVLRGGSIIIYSVIVGAYDIEITLLNLNMNGPHYGTVIGKGSYGKIILMNSVSQYVAKRFYFSQHSPAEDSEAESPEQLPFCREI